MDKDNPIFVTKPFLPPLDEYIPYLKEIWERRILTNNGPYHQQLEEELCNFLGVEHISLFSNGTLALLTAIQALRITGEVITTPFSFVATTHALWWNNITPVFADIDPITCCLDPKKIIPLITPKTTAILPVHVYGMPCNIDEIAQIAEDYNLKVIYDAAHTFGAKYRGKAICYYGDLAVLSFHATKVYNTFEGGAIICKDAKMKRHIDDLKNFGFRDEVTIVTPGINAKMNEAQAALGLLQLKYINQIIEKRKKIAETYFKKLSNCKGITFLPELADLEKNYAYFPVFIDENEFGISRDEVYYELRKKNIYTRRYFYPLISQFKTYKELPTAQKGKLPIAEQKAQQVLCLPIYPELEIANAEMICNLIMMLGKKL